MADQIGEHANEATASNGADAAGVIKNAPEATLLSKPSELSQEEQERAVGITEYTSPDAPGFTCIVKQRYTDFLVNEILPTGQVLHLTDIARPGQKKQRPERNGKEQAKDGHPTGGASNGEVAAAKAESNGHAGQKRPLGEADGTDEVASKKTKTEAPQAEKPESKAAPPPASEVSVEEVAEVEAIFGVETTKGILELYASVCAHPHRKPRDHATITSEIITEKSKRTDAHISVRKIFKAKLETVTLQDTPGAISIRAAPPHNNNNPGRRTDVQEGRGTSNKKGKLQWEDLGGEYLHFTLYKENKDTMEVLYFMASQLKLKINSFQFAGTKDRRGVTVQRVAGYRIRAEQLMGLARIAKNWSIGGFEHKKHGLDLGELRGNEFLLTLRDCNILGEQLSDPKQRLEFLRTAVRDAAANFSEKGYINYFGLQRFGSFSTGTHTVGLKMLQDDLEGAVKSILSYHSHLLPEHHDPSDDNNKTPQDDIDRADAIRIWETTGNSREALYKMPRRFQAENSMIQYLGKRGRNKELTQNHDWRGALQSIQRNLRLMYVHAYQSLIWNIVAGKRRELYGHEVVEGDLVIVGEKFGRSDDTQPKAQVDQDGEPIIRPSGEDAAPEDPFTRARPLTAEEAASGTYTAFDLVLPLPGWDVIYPSNAIGKFYEELMASDRGGKLDPHNMRRGWKDISLSGGYRKILSKPEGLSVDVRPYGDETEQMVETDAEKIRKAETEKVELDEGGVKVENTEAEAEAKGDKIAVVLKMQLGSSQYATMALRELTKGGAMAYKPDFSAAR